MKHTPATTFDPQAFLDEIEKVLPRTTCPLSVAGLTGGRQFLQDWVKLHPFGLHRGLSPEDILNLTQVVETLHCCGVAPEGWPPPPDPSTVSYLGGMTWTPPADPSNQ